MEQGSFLMVDYAKSNRATCKGCKIKIDKGKIRIGVKQETGDYPIIQWRHLECFSYIPKWAKNIPSDVIEGIEKISQEDKDKVQQYIKSIVETGGQIKKVKKDSIVNKLSLLENKEQNSLLAYSDIQFEQYKKEVQDLSKKGNKELQEMLKINNQTFSNKNKDQLIDSIADGRILGQIPICPKCNGGKLRFDSKQAKYFCKGYMDDTTYIHCNKKFDFDEIKRNQWIEI